MARDVNLASKEWCDLIFEGKNKKYGAYYLRKTSSRRHIRSLIIVLGVTAGLVFLPSLIKQVLPNRQVETIKEVVVMTTVDLDVPIEDQVIEQAPPPPPPAVKSAIAFPPPLMDKDATEDEEMKSQEEVTKSTAVIFSTDIKGSDDVDAVDPHALVKQKEVVKEVTQAPKQEKPLDYAEVMPVFPGGEAEMMKYLNENTRYPMIAQENGVEGRVSLRFAVMEDGSISNITVLRSVHKSLDEEAIRVVKSMPKWIPGRQNGKAVAVYFSLPVNFTIQQQR